MQPYGITDPDAPYINGDPSVGRMGSIPPAAAFEHPMRELVNVIEMAKLVPDETDLQQVGVGIRSQRANYVEDSGAVNTLSVALDPPLTEYTPGLVLRVKVYSTNTGASTIDAGAGRVSIKKPNGAETAPGDLPAGGLIELGFDGTNFQMMSNVGTSGGGAGDVFVVKIPYCVDTSVTPNTITANFSPAITAPDLVAGLTVMVKVANTNTNFTNININGLGLKPVWAQGGAPNWPLLPSDMIAGDVLIFTYDGTRFWIYANTVLNQSTSFTVANNTQFNDLMYALGRKRILPTVSVVINMATGTYGPISTLHPNADNITVRGTMKAGRPVYADFAKTGSSAAARAADSANNIAMLRTRYGTEIHVDNTYIGYALSHSGGGKPRFEDILITGAGTSAPQGWPQSAVNPAFGASMIISGVSAWGMGSGGIGAIGGCLVEADNSFICGSEYGFGAAMGGQLVMSACGSFGNKIDGLQVNRKSSVSMHARAPGDPTGLPPVPGCQFMMNGNVGIWVDSASNVGLETAVITGNGVNDMVAWNQSNISAVTGSTYGAGRLSPALNTVGNNNSIITA